MKVIKFIDPHFGCLALGEASKFVEREPKALLFVGQSLQTSFQGSHLGKNGGFKSTLSHLVCSLKRSNPLSNSFRKINSNSPNLEEF